MKIKGSELKHQFKYRSGLNSRCSQKLMSIYRVSALSTGPSFARLSHYNENFLESCLSRKINSMPKDKRYRYIF